MEECDDAIQVFVEASIVTREKPTKPKEEPLFRVKRSWLDVPDD